jgi:hypothetical protein
MSSDSLSPVGDSSELLKPIPVPPETIEEAKRSFNERETLEAIPQIRRTGGRKFEDVIVELEVLPSESAKAQ